MRPVMLDLCCRAGGAAKGYADAGWDVIGVDVEPQPDYPFWFRQGDALEVLSWLIDGGSLLFHKPGYFWPRTVSPADIVGVHASWPCQAANPLNTGTNVSILGADRHPQLIPEGRELMEKFGRPAVIENTAGAPIRHDLTLNGDMFELGVWRPRYFELLNGLTIPQPDGPRRPSRGRVRGWRHRVWSDGPYVAVYGKGGGKASVPEAQQAMGIDWMTDIKDLAEAIPPAYTRYIGTEWLRGA